MIKLSYNTNGLRNMPLERAIAALAEFKYDGIELSLHESHLHPLKASRDDLIRIKEVFKVNGIKPICLATGADKLLSHESYEPSLVTSDKEGRKKRIDFIRTSIEVAKFLDIPVVNFASGILRTKVDSRKIPRDYLLEGIQACLKDIGDVVLAIEPEPGFFIETTTQAISLIQEINSPHFMLNMDLGHVNCCEDDFLEAIERSLPYTRHIHIEDIRQRIHHHEIPGEGDIDFEAVFNRLEGYLYYISVELYHHSDVWEKALKESRDYLLSKMDRLVSVESLRA